MQVEDIRYDGELLSEHNLKVCFIDGNRGDEISNGNILNVTQVKAVHASKWLTTSASYDEVLQFDFEVAKLFCNEQGSITDYSLSDTEVNDILYWLNRKEMHKMEIIMDDGISFKDCYYNGTFTTVNPIMISESIVGFHLIFLTDSPFAHLPDIELSHEYDGDESNTEWIIDDTSNEEGWNYCDVTIKCLEAGDLSFRNSRDEKATVIKNCLENEIINIRGSIKYIETNESLHKTFSSDFNYHFPRLLNKRGNVQNKFTSSLKCEVTLTYTPIRKAGGFIC